MISKIYITLIFFVACIGTQAAVLRDTTEIRKAQIEDLSLFVNDFVRKGPAFNGYHRRYNISLFGISRRDRDEKETYLIERGSAERNRSAFARSFIHLNPRTTLYGKAEYRKQKQYNVLMNSTLDFDFIYPQHTAFRIEKDADIEIYAFDGGFSHKTGKWMIGAETDFTAAQKYWQSDPRPRAVSSDLNAKIGCSRILGGHYGLRINASGRRYKQSFSTISMSDDHKGPEYDSYNMLGPLYWYALYSDYNPEFSLQYQGYGYGMGGGLFSTAASGFHIYGEYARITVDRFYNRSDMNLDVPISDLTLHTASGILSYRHVSGPTRIGFKGEATYNHKTSNEIYARQKAGMRTHYLHAGALETFYSDTRTFDFAALYGFERPGSFTLEIMPHAGIFKHKEELIMPKQSADVMHVFYGVVLNLNKSLGRHFIHMGGECAYRNNCRSEKELMIVFTARDKTIELSDKSPYGRIIWDAFRLRTSDMLRLRLCLRYSFDLTGDMAVFAEHHWSRFRFVGRGHYDTWDLRVGIIF